MGNEEKKKNLNYIIKTKIDFGTTDLNLKSRFCCIVASLLNSENPLNRE